MIGELHSLRGKTVDIRRFQLLLAVARQVTVAEVIAIDVGHVGQNLYLACEAIGAGTCAIAAYDQPACDILLGLDGVDEFTIYVAPVG